MTLCRGAIELMVEDQLGRRKLRAISMYSVVGHVALEEDDPMSSAGERFDQTSPERRVAVSPGGADREPEHDELHRHSSRSVFTESRFTSLLNRVSLPS